MRVVAGILGGRSFDAPRGHRTHPMSDKIRGAIFNALGDIEGLTVLDAYAGSGALSIEAVSRGAQSCVAIDVDKSAYTAIQANVVQLRIADRVRAIRANAVTWSALNIDSNFDLVFLDPPYDKVNPKNLQTLALHVKHGGIVVVSLPPHITFKIGEDFEQVAHSQYGDATLHFYRRVSSFKNRLAAEQ